MKEPDDYLEKALKIMENHARKKNRELNLNLSEHHIKSFLDHLRDNLSPSKLKEIVLAEGISEMQKQLDELRKINHP